MARFFKQETKQPFTYPSITERRSSSGYLVWIVGVIFVILLLVVILALIKFMNP